MRIYPTVLATLLAIGTLTDVAADPVPYPAGYREWVHVESMLIEPGHPLFDSFGGLHHLCANEQAVTGYRSGRFSDGSVIVFDLLTPVSADHAVTEGVRKVLGVMHKDWKRYAATGGWGFEGFVGDSHTERAVGDKAATACFSCHETLKDSGYVFSELLP
jgi:hypothetical protein